MTKPRLLNQSIKSAVIYGNSLQYKSQIQLNPLRFLEWFWVRLNDNCWRLWEHATINYSNRVGSFIGYRLILCRITNELM